MPNYYSVIQYVPDEVVGERINIGVVVFGSGRTLTHFLSSWNRVRQFAPVDVIADLRDFARHAKKLDEQAIRSAAARWTYGLQFTQPAGSLLSDDALLLDAASRYLQEPPAPSTRGYLVKSDVTRMAHARMKEALKSHYGGLASILLKSTYRVKGEYGAHTFDLTVANGQPYVAAETVSFQDPEEKKVEKDVSAAAWAIRDVRRENRTLPLAVIVASPATARMGVFDQARRLFADEGANVILESEIDKWAREVTANLPLPPRQI